MSLIWKETSKTLAFKSLIFGLYRVGFKSELSGKEGLFDVLHTRDWINIVPITKDQKVVMVKQFRFGSQEVTLEFPAGAMNLNEAPIAAAKRELLEETGSTSERVNFIGKCRPNPAFLNNTCHYFVAHDVVMGKEQNLDELEEVEVTLVPLSEIDDLVRTGAICNAMAIVAWQYYQLSLKGR